MKINAATLALLTAAVSAGPAVDPCVEQTAMLVANPDLEAELVNIGAAIEADVTDNFLGFCDLTTTVSCTINADDYDDDFVAACGTAGGQIVTKTVTTSCSGSFNNFPIPAGLAFSVEDFPTCIGADCDPDMLPTEIDEKFDAAVNNILGNITEGLGGSIMCEIVSEPGSTMAPPANTTEVDTTAAPETTGDASETTEAATTEEGSTEAPPTTAAPTSSAAIAVGSFGAVFGAVAFLTGL